MIATRPDWCISRQRVWGVPIIVFYCEGCQEPLTDRKILDRVVDLFAQHTADVWYHRSRRPNWSAPDAKCAQVRRRRRSAKRTTFSTSGSIPASSHLAVLTPRERSAVARRHVSGRRRSVSRLVPQLAAGRRRPEGRRAVSRTAPPTAGRSTAKASAMSKSMGNVIEPEKIINKYGADVLRLWVASVDFTEDVRFSDTILERLIEAYRKLRNTFRYALGQPARFRSGDGCRARRRRCSRSTAGFWRAPKIWSGAAAAGTTSSRSTRSIARSTISRRPI